LLALSGGGSFSKLAVYGTIEEIAAAEKINSSYVGRVLRLTLLAPEIVEAILDGLQPVEMTLATLMRPFAVQWDDQRTAVEIGGGRQKSHRRRHG
jgi:hypothetical protein